MKHRQPALSQQRGIVAIFMTAAMFVLIAAGALAIDVGHQVLNKGRLQNMVDAAALGAAATLDKSSSQNLAELAAWDSLRLNVQDSGNGQFDLDTANVLIEFSDVLPFDASTSSTGAQYVRVRISQVKLKGFMVQLFNLQKSVAATAVAGPSSSLSKVCNLVPMMVCAKNTGSSSDFFGYSYGGIEVLKISSKQDAEVGAGNFQLVRLDGNTGAADLRKAMAGDFNACADADEDIITEPGNTVGPVAQGLNTRFGEYSGAGLNATDYPSDLFTQSPTPTINLDDEGNALLPIGKTWEDIYGYEDYMQDYKNCSSGAGNCPASNVSSCLTDPSSCTSRPFRRLLPVLIGLCDGETNGTNTVPYAGVGCFFLLQPVVQKGNESYVIGQFIEECGVASGNPGIIPSNRGPYKIQLYHDPESGES